MRLLFSWIGNSDLMAAKKNDPSDPGPVRRLLDAVSSGKIRPFDSFCFLSDFPTEDSELICDWLAKAGSPGVDFKRDFKIFQRPLSNNYSDTYSLAVAAVRRALDETSDQSGRTAVFLISPGTPAMQLSMLVAASGLEDEIPGLQVEVLNSSPQKGIEPVELPFQLRADMRRSAMRGLLSQTFSQVHAHPSFDTIIGSSQSLLGAKKQATRWAQLQYEEILLLGETGTGKELFARAIHDASPRGKGPFVPVNCAAIPESLFESEIFGHVKGAFTGADKDKKGKFENSAKGTLFFDEIGELSPINQAKLLRLVQEKAFVPVGSSDPEKKLDVRLIFATHRDLGKMVAAGGFRRDLYERISTLVVKIPALRERRGDIEALSKEFLADFRSTYPEHGKDLAFSHEALAALRNHSWPGNVRELQKVVKQIACCASAGSAIPAEVVWQFLGEGYPESSKPIDCLDDGRLAELFLASFNAVLRRCAVWIKDANIETGQFMDAVVWPLVLGYLKNEKALPFESKVGESVSASLGASGMQENAANRRRLECYRKLKESLRFDASSVEKLLNG